MLGQKHIYPLRPTIAQCVARISELSGISVEAIRGPQKAVHVVRARHWAMYEARRYSGRSLPQIGHWLGGRDHSTVIYGIRRHAEREGIELDPPAKRATRTRRQLNALLFYWRSRAEELEARLAEAKAAQEGCGCQ